MCATAALPQSSIGLGVKGTAVGVRRRYVHDAIGGWIHLLRSARVPGERHRRVARAMIRALARHDPARGTCGGLPGELYRVLVGVRTAKREEHPPAGEARLLKQQFRQSRPRLGAPGARDEAQLRCLGAHRLDHLRVLVPEVAALRQAAHVENRAALGGEEARAATAHDRRRSPVALAAPGMEYGLCLGEHRLRRRLLWGARSAGPCKASECRLRCTSASTQRTTCRQRAIGWTETRKLSGGAKDACPMTAVVSSRARAGALRPPDPDRWGVSSVGRASDF